MTSILPKKGDRFWICPAFFLLAAAPGFWLPVLANILDAKGWGSYTTIAFMVLPLSAIILIFSARADQAISAEKLLTVIVGAGATFQELHSSSLSRKHPVLFLLFRIELTGNRTRMDTFDNYYPEQFGQPGEI